jgi:methylmalonyl-CoA mutase N-terminal domain/subunit
LALPTEESARIALRTQQIIAHESGVTNTVDPVGGSECIESLTDAIEREVHAYLKSIEEAGGTLRAIETGYIQNQIQNAAYDYQRGIESGERVVVGVNRFQKDEERVVPTFRSPSARFPTACVACSASIDRPSPLLGRLPRRHGIETRGR